MSDTSSEEEEEKALRKVFFELTKGYSKALYNKEEIYVKHFDYEDQIEIDDYYDQIFKKVKEKGLPTTAEAFEYIKEEGLWTPNDDKGLLEANMFLEGCLRRRKSLVIPSQIMTLEKEIAKARKEVDKWESEKRDLLHDTCETYTDKKVNDFGMWVLFYKDAALTKRLFTWKEFYEIEKAELGLMFALFLQTTGALTVSNMKKISIAPFFCNYYNLLGDNGHQFFGDRNVWQLSFNQVTLLSYARAFKNIFENMRDIPDEIRNNPDALLDFAESNKKAEKFRSKAASKDGYSVVGASKKDMRRMGLGGQEDTVDLSELARQKGGKLGIQDFAQM